MDPTIVKGVAEAAFPNTYAEGVRDAAKVVMAHVPSMTDEDMLTIEGLAAQWALDEDTEAADLAIRTCACGQKIDGFYQYVDHLTVLLTGRESHLGG